jgi:penicillin amidase
MKAIKWVLGVLIILVILLFAYSYSVFKKTQPKFEGRIKATGLKSSVKIIRDIHAIPHIYAENTHDLFFAQGYITAQDRLWQMDLSRRIAMGRLSEIFGERTVELDYFFRTLEIKEIAERIYEKLDKETKTELKAYSSGVNRYIKSGKKPLESIILRYDIEPWSPIDSISIHLLSAFDLSINMDEEIFAMKALKKFGEKTVKELFPDYPSYGNTIILEEIKKLNLDLDIPDGFKIAKEEFGLFLGKGASNNWVVDGIKSMSGRPILANDPHLRAQIPSVWYEVHLKAPGINVIGATFPGSPYVLIGHNEKIAWGFTDAMADRVDLFIEKVNPENPHKYWYIDRWKDMRIKKVDIKIKDKGGYRTIMRESKYTRHGPIINSFKDGIEGILSMRWTGSEVEDQTLRAISILNRGRNIEEIKEGIKYGKIYTQNMVYADVDGNIGYQLTGDIPIRKKGTGKFPVPGWTDEYEWSGFIPHEKLPNLLNPTSHFIATANNKIVGDSFPYIISNTWAPPYRYERIVFLLRQKEKLSLEDFKKMQADVYSVPARKFVEEIIKVQSDDPEIKRVLKELSGWDYEVASTSLPALLYEVIRMNLIRNTFYDELGELYSEFLYTLNFNYNLIDKIIENPSSRWWDDITTPGQEGRDEIIIKSIQDAIREIREELGIEKETWNWGRLHKYRFIHPLGQVKFLSWVFNPEPIPAEGDRDTINNSYFRYKIPYDSCSKYGSPYDATFISSYRFIVDLSDIDHALGMNSTGQSGNPFSKHYTDMVQRWARVEYHPLLFDPEDIEKNKWKELILVPENHIVAGP